MNIKKYQSFSDNKDTKFRIANVVDRKKIQNDIYPYLNGYGENDKKYLEEPNTYTIIIAEKNNKIIHYFLVFENSNNSPLVRTPIKKNILKNKSAYLGSAFTIPSERGLWIMAYSISYAINYLKENTNREKVLLLVHERTAGAKNFFERLGFNIIKNAAPAGPIQWLLRKIKIRKKLENMQKGNSE